MKCPDCHGERMEKRGEKRIYADLNDAGETDGWSEGEESWDSDSLGREVVYCYRCDAEWVVVDGGLVAPDYSTQAERDAAALDAITETMSGQEWSPETLEDIAERVRASGRLIADPDDMSDHDAGAPTQVEREDWQYEVANGDTSLGFEEWVAHKQEAENGTV